VAQAFCDRALYPSDLYGVIVVDDNIDGGFTGLITVTVTLNSGELNEVSKSFDLNVIDPCEADAVITIDGSIIEANWDQYQWV